MMSARAVRVGALCAAMLAGAGLYAYRSHRAAPAPQPVGGARAGPAAAPAQPATVVEVAEVVLRSMPLELAAVGTLASSQSVMLRPEIAGRIARIDFADGARVARGALLFLLDDATPRAELAQARASLELARSEATRVEDLFGRKFVSLSARDQARANLRVAEAALELAEARLARNSIRAPFGGVLGIRSVSLGDYVKEGADLVNLEDLTRVNVDFRLPESEIGKLASGQAVSVAVDAWPGQSFPARIEAIDPQVDAQGRSVLVRARIDNAQDRLRPGMFARVRVRIAERGEVPVVPEEAIVASSAGSFVFVVDGDQARRVEVEAGLRRDAVVELRRGPEAGTKVVVAGQLKLRDGASVRIAADPAAR